jgi:tRNA A37 threonylcarbamoyladenosine synthetase subunit TsaC/SUA5/YrdC
MGNGEVVVLPTETVYMACTLLSLESDEAAPQRPSNKRKSSLFLFPVKNYESVSRIMTSFVASLISFFTVRIICPDHHDREAPTLLMQRPLAMLDRLMPFAQKPYAIQEKDGKASAPVVFSEHREVLIRLAKKFWPGPMAMYMRTDSESLPIQSVGGKTYVGVSNPSHPLTNRLLNEASSNSRIVVGKPAFRANSCTINKKNPYMTKAAEVCSYYASQFLTEKHTVHVLNGEDKREPFAVPTCQYGTPCSYSLWIDETCRTVYIRGKQEDPSVLQEGSILRAIGSISSSPTEDERTKNRLRVTTAVLRRWKVVDERLSPILDGTA